MNPQRILLLAALLGTFWIGQPAFSDTKTAFALNGQLHRQLQLLDQIVPHVERLDLSRLMFLRREVTQVIESIEAKGLAHAESIQKLQELVIAYRFSKAQFTQIRTLKTGNAIDELIKINTTLAHDTGYDQTLATQITASTFTQIHRLLQALAVLSIGDSLKQEIKSLQQPLGQLVAIARNGDDLKTFTEAKKVLVQLESLMPHFDQISVSNAAFYTILEIQGLTEFYREFSGTNRLEELNPSEVPHVSSK